MNMKMKRGTVLVLVCGFCFMCSSSAVCAEAVQGRLERLGPNGISPAPYILVTLKSSQTGKYHKPVQTETNGMYYFDDIAPGDYSLEIWPQGAPPVNPFVLPSVSGSRSPPTLNPYSSIGSNLRNRPKGAHLRGPIPSMSGAAIPCRLMPESGSF
jgi:hypothetical protein